MIFQPFLKQLKNSIMKIKIALLSLFLILITSCKENSEKERNDMIPISEEKEILISSFPYSDIVSYEKQLYANTSEAHIIAETNENILGLKGVFTLDGNEVKTIEFQSISPFKRVTSAKFEMIKEVYTLSIELESTLSNDAKPVLFNIPEIPNQLESHIYTAINIKTFTDSLLKPIYKGHVFKRPTK
jgi:hypothetical protein